MSRPHKRTAFQARAADPSRNVWVNASAGTGKTQVLTDRILRLMLAGSAPERILALTFTKAAAAEMEIRLTNKLGSWQTMEETGLRAELEALGVDGAPTQVARGLFARVLDLPSGLNIQTIHGFAQGLLASFPLEAGLPPGFSALADRDASALKSRALNEAIADARTAGDDWLIDDLGMLAVAKAETGVRQLIDRMLGHSEALAAFRTIDGIQAAVWRQMGLQSGQSEEEALTAAVIAPAFPEEALDRTIEGWLAWKTATGAKYAERLASWKALPAKERAAELDLLRSGLLATNGKPFSTTNAAKAAPWIEQSVVHVVAAYEELNEVRCAYQGAELAARALRVGHSVAVRYRALKQAAAVIDYDDMIERAVALLGMPGMPSWVNWKLDQRFDHLLVDEAQDTNASQWAIIEKLVEEYFAGADERQRTLFVVGDLKQAIYGFQGTDPRVFAGKADELGARARLAERPIDFVPLDLSFRSGPAVIDVVNAFLGSLQPAELGLEEAPLHHQPNRRGAAGEVVLWPLLTAEEAEAEDGGEDQEEATAEDAARLMAEKLGEQIARWLRAGDEERLWLPAHRRWARAEDILILVRKRGELMGHLVAALHREDVPVAGVDRLLLTEPYAVLDLLTLVRFAVQPEDDLNLAALLVSPFLGFDHEEVRRLSAARGNRSLWRMLGEDESDRSRNARSWLVKVLNLADRVPPYVFLDTVLSPPFDGRRLLRARLGTEADQAIDELLSQALAFEAKHPPLLLDFLTWVTAEGVEVKREPDTVRPEVRLMTIHGAKGLEAPVVVLADTGFRNAGRRPPDVPVEVDGVGELPFALGASGERPRVIREAAEQRSTQERQEDLRLLYVALTRAADHLFIGGAIGARDLKMIEKEDVPRWHRRMQLVMAGMPAVERLQSSLWRGEILRVRAGQWVEPDGAATVVVAETTRHSVLSGLALGPAPAVGPLTRPLAPSSLPEGPPAPALRAKMRAAAQRGKLMHGLFERLPAVRPENRRTVALKWLTGHGLGPDDSGPMLDDVLRVIEDPAYRQLFGPDALAEAPVAGIVSGRMIAGVVDRLLVRDDGLFVVDFKTGQHVPEDVEKISVAYVRQMAAYRAVLSAAFPGRPIEAALLYTSGPKLFLLPPKQMDAALPLDQDALLSI